MDNCEPTLDASSRRPLTLSVLQAVVLPLALVAIVLTAACDQTPTPTSEPVKLRLTPSDRLGQLTEETPEEFGWDLFNSEVIVSAPDSLEAAPNHEITLSLCAIRVRGTETDDPQIDGERCTQQVALSGEQLERGVSSAFVAGHEGHWTPGTDWFPLNRYTPRTDGDPYVEPDDAVEIQQMPGAGNIWVEAVLIDRTLTPSQGMVVVYAQPDSTGPVLAGSSSPGAEVQPFGLILEERDTAVAPTRGRSFRKTPASAASRNSATAE